MAAKSKPPAANPVAKNLRIKRPKVIRSKVLNRRRPKHRAGHRSERPAAA
jgi:hypothetical protein